MQRTLMKETVNAKCAGQAFHILRRVSIPESFLFFTEVGQYTGKFAPSLDGLLKEIENAPLKSIQFHFKRGDFQKWIRNIVEDDDLALRINSLKPGTRGNKLRRSIQNIVKERVNELKREMWLVQHEATRLERTNLFGQRMMFGIDLSKIE
jgi:hypothetical protein